MIDKVVLKQELTPEQVMCLVNLAYASGRIRTAVEYEGKGLHLPTASIDETYRRVYEMVIPKLLPLARESEYIGRKLRMFEEMYQAYATLTSD